MTPTEASSIWTALLSQSPMVIVMGIGIYFLYKSDQAKAKRNDEWIERVLKDKDAEITEIKLAARECTEKHEATRAKLEKITLALAKLPDFDTTALNSAPMQSHRAIMDTRPG